jgi:outer membrane protein
MIKLSRYLNPYSILLAIIFLLGTGVPHSSAGEIPAFLVSEGSKPQPRLITIAEGIKMVLKDSRILKIALADKDMAVDDSFLARSALLPQINGSISQSFLQKQPGAKFGGQQVNTAEKRSLAYGFDVYQTLFDFKRSVLSYQAAQLMVNASEAGFVHTQKLAILEFIIAYFDLLESEKMIEVADKEVESIASYAKDVENLYRQGVVIKNDLLAAQVRLADAKQKLIFARNLREIAQSRLATILALPLFEEIRAEDIRMGVPNMPTLPDSWKQAEIQRSEIKVIDKQAAAVDAAMRAKLTGNYPTVFVDGGYSYSENKYMTHDDNMFVNLGAKVDLYDGGLAKAAASKERDRKNKLLQERQKLIDDIKLEVKDSYLGVKDALDKVAVSREALAQAEENVRVNRVSFAEGSTSSTAVLEAITMQTNAQTNYYRADYQLKRDYTKLMYSMGIDLELVYESMQKGQ